MAKYGPRTKVHPTRHGPKKTTKNIYVVLHTSEGGEGFGTIGNQSAEQLSAFMETPATATNVASYNNVFDTDRNLPAVPYDVVPYAAGGGNAHGIHGCFPGKAGQTRDQWLDQTSLAQLRQAAEWIVDVCREFGIPMRRITWEQVKAGESGICDHHAISLAFKKSTHTDVGTGFPWDVLFAMIDAVVGPEPEPEPEPEPTPEPTPTPTPTPQETLMITVFQPTDCAAEFIGMADAKGNVLELEWVKGTAEDIARRDEHIKAGAIVVKGPHRNGRFKNCTLARAGR